MQEPPPGRALQFNQFVELVIDRVRARIPTIRATRIGSLIHLRHGQGTISIDPSTWTVWREGAQRHLIVSIGDRRDAFAAESVAVTIANALG